MQPTPWSVKDMRLESAPSAASGGLAESRVRRSGLNGYWGYLGAAAGGIVTLILLFRPWLTASGADGKASVNAFGRMTATTSLLNIWSSSPPPAARISGAFAILAAAAITVTVCAVVANLRRRTEALSRVATISAVTVAVLVVLTVLYMNSKSPELRAMLARTSDLGGQAGMVLSWAFGNGSIVVPGIRQISYDTAGLTSWALLAGATSLVSAITAVAQWIYDHPPTAIRLPWRVAIHRSAASEQPARRRE
ncbi:hypothetical protein [Nocardia pneumoniae]|uniref:hypothetical protein n=1 Tax=Nocardia pneumoniae TaxID=228601 RepID=UPI0012F69B19|nr:hypothetical protein [Nocardia pneumoniae]